MLRIHKKITKFVASKLFFYLTAIFFVFEGVWIAISARYPMAFDEAYHIGIIRLYAKQWSPFFTKQPPGPATYGALTRDPSYIFHYLMSFPYRIVDIWSSSVMIHLITLRLIDVAFMAAGLLIFRSLLLKTRATPAIVNLTLLFFVLTPTVPLLAGQVNYDDLMIPLTGLTLLLAVKFIQAFSKGRFSPGFLSATLVVGALACLVKFPFLPIYTAIVIYLSVLIWKKYKSNRKSFIAALKMGWHRSSSVKRIVIISSLIIGAGLFINTYFVNIIVYQNPIPQCGQVLGVERCHTYAPWARNYADALANKGVDINPLVFIGNWIYGMFDRVFFVINGPGPLRSYDNHIAPVIAITAATLGIFAIVLLFRYGKNILKKDKILVFLLFTSFAYVVALIGRNYHDYLHLGKIVAINGRYLLPILLPIYLIIVQSYQEFLKNKPLFRDVFFIIIFLLFLQGGGVISYLYYSNPAYWFWPNDRFVNSVSRSVKKVINPVFINNQRIPFLITTKDKIYTKFNIQ